MSIAVDLDQLASALEGYTYGYLLTSSTGGVKAVTVTASVDGDEVDIPVGSRGSARNLAGNPIATLLFPPSEPGGYSLIVDGTASVTDHGFRLAPAKAVLHRPVEQADGDPSPVPDTGCGHDCRPL